jgi:phage baseplate assembly protein W
MALQRRYKDFDLAFKNHPITGDIGTKTDLEVIKQSIRNLIRTLPYDRAYHPEIGTRIKNILFMDVSSMSSRMLKTIIKEVLDAYEPRIDVNKINVTASTDLLQYSVTVIFTIVNTANPINVTTLLNRVR